MQQQINTLSEYNEMAMHIARLNDIWINCRRKRNSGNLIGWKWELDSAYIELRYDAIKVDKAKNTDYMDQLSKVDGDILQAEKKADMPELYQYLKKKEEVLREVQQLCGKGTKYSDDWDEGL